MMKSFLKYYNFRSFSRCRVRANMEKAKPSAPPQPSEPPTSNSDGALKIGLAPTDFQKRILVWSGKYKSMDEVPPRVSYDTLDKARSVVRIKGTNIMMVGTVIMFAVYIWRGKQRLKEGDTIRKRQLENDQRILEKHGKSKQE